MQIFSKNCEKLRIFRIYRALRTLREEKSVPKHPVSAFISPYFSPRLVLSSQSTSYNRRANRRPAASQALKTDTLNIGIN